MAVKSYVGSGDKAKNIKLMYVGVAGKAHKILKAYVGVNGKAKLVYSLGVWEKWNSVYYQYYTQGPWETLSPASSEFTGHTSYSFDSSTGIFSATGGTITVGPTKPGTAYTSGGRDIGRYVFSGGSGTIYTRDARGPYGSYTKGSTSYGLVYALPGTYPDNGRASDGYWYVKKT